MGERRRPFGNRIRAWSNSRHISARPTVSANSYGRRRCWWWRRRWFRWRNNCVDSPSGEREHKTRVPLHTSDEPSESVGTRHWDVILYYNNALHQTVYNSIRRLCAKLHGVVWLNRGRYFCAQVSGVRDFLEALVVVVLWARNMKPI